MSNYDAVYIDTITGDTFFLDKAVNSGVAQFKYVQNVEASIWTLYHKQASDKFVLKITDENGNKIYPDSVKIFDENTIVINFSTAIKGEVVLIFFDRGIVEITPSVTPTSSVTPSVTPSISLTPTVSTTLTPTPTMSATLSPTPSLSFGASICGTVSTDQTTLLGSTNQLIEVFSGSNDDASYPIGPLPFDFYFDGVNYGNGQNGGIYVGSNGYVTFGFGSSSYSGFSASNPGKGILIQAADNSVQQIFQNSYSTNEAFVIRFEGTSSTSGSVGSSNMIWEMTFYKNQKIQLVVGSMNRTSGVCGISNGATFLDSTVYNANTSYAIYDNDGDIGQGLNWTAQLGSITCDGILAPLPSPTPTPTPTPTSSITPTISITPTPTLTPTPSPRVFHAALDPSYIGTGTLSADNLTAYMQGDSTRAVGNRTLISGNIYWEVTILSESTHQYVIGIMYPSIYNNGSGNHLAGCYGQSQDNKKVMEDSYSDSGVGSVSLNPGDVVGVQYANGIDQGTCYLFITINGVTAFPGILIDSTLRTTPMCPLALPTAVYNDGPAGILNVSFNFGDTPFVYTPPSGALSFNSVAAETPTPTPTPSLPASGTTYFDPVTADPNLIISNNFLTVSSEVGSNNNARTNIARSTGKWYWEASIDSGVSGDGWFDIGMIRQSLVLHTPNYISQDNTGFTFECGIGYGGVNTHGNSNWIQVTTYPDPGIGDIIQICVDLDTKQAWYKISSQTNWYSGDDPSTGNGSLFFDSTEPLVPAVDLKNMALTFRFKASSQTLTPPTGFLPWDSN